MTHWKRTVLSFLVAMHSPSVLAEDSGASLASRSSQIVSSAPKSATFRAGTRQRYRVVVGLRAVVRGHAATEARMAELGLAPETFVETKGPFLIFQSASPGVTAALRVSGASAVTTLATTPAYPVVVNVRSGRLAILPGIVIARLRDPADAAALAQANGLAVDFVAEQIRYAFFRVPPGLDVIAAAATVARDARVEAAYPEVRESFSIPD